MDSYRSGALETTFLVSGILAVMVEIVMVSKLYCLLVGTWDFISVSFSSEKWPHGSASSWAFKKKIMSLNSDITGLAQNQFPFFLSNHFLLYILFVDCFQNP